MTADPDQDCVQNFVEWMFGTDPKESAPPPIEWVITDTTISASFPVDLSAGGMVVSLQVSSDLVTWLDWQTYAVGHGLGIENIEVAAIRSFGSRAFARLMFTRP
jgi:hypothetical protein